jgi:hypothetical protein
LLETNDLISIHTSGGLLSFVVLVSEDCIDDDESIEIMDDALESIY